MSISLLIAEDDAIMRDTLCACVRAEGFQPISARHGREALELWQRYRPKLLCLDIMMPEMDGYEVCRQVRKQDSTVPILFLSAKKEELDVVVGLELGADDFIRKPFTRAKSWHGFGRHCVAPAPQTGPSLPVPFRPHRPL